MEDEDIILNDADRGRLDGIVKEMEANQESAEDIQFVVNDFKQKYGSPAKKKETTDLPSPSISEGTPSVSGLEPSETASQEFDHAPGLEAFFDLESRDPSTLNPTEQLYLGFLNAKSLTEEQQLEVQETVAKEAEGDFGLIEGFIEGFDRLIDIGYQSPFETRRNKLLKEFSKEFSVPVGDIGEEELKGYYLAKREEELSESFSNSNIEDYIKNLTPEQKGDLEFYSKTRDLQLNDRNKYRAFAFEAAMQDAKIANSRGDKEATMANLEIAKEMVDEIARVEDDLMTPEKEKDLLKRNYSNFDNFVGKVGVAGLEMALNVDKALNDIADLGGLDNNLITSSALQIAEKITDIPNLDVAIRQATQDVIEEERASLRRTKSVSEIDSLSDLGEWAVDITAEQTPNIMALATTGGTVGLSIIGTSAYGNKLGELENREALGLDSYTPLEKRTAAFMSAGAEVLTERVSLGILNKTKRFVKSGVNAGLRKELQRSIASELRNKLVSVSKESGKAFLKEGGSEAIAELANNMVDRYYLDNKEVQLTDNILDAFVAGGFLGGAVFKAPQIGAAFVKPFLPKDTQQKIGENLERIASLTEAMEKPISPEVRATIEEQIAALDSKNSNILGAVVKNISEMDSGVIKQVEAIEGDLYNLRRKYTAIIEDANLSQAQKQDIIQVLDEEYKRKSQQKSQIINDEISREKTPQSPEEDTLKELPEIKAGDTFQAFRVGKVELGFNESIHFAPTSQIAEGFKGMTTQKEVNKFNVSPSKVFKVSEHLDETGVVQEKGKLYRELEFTKNKENIDRLREEGYDVIDATFIDLDGNVAGEYVVLNPDIIQKVEDEVTEQQPDTGAKEETTDTSDVQPIRDTGQPGGIPDPIQQPEAEVTSESIRPTVGRLLSGVPVISYLDEITFTRLANKMDTAIAKKVQEGLASKNKVVRNASEIAVSWFNGLARTGTELARKRKLQGKQEMAYVEGSVMTKELQGLVGFSPEAATRVHSALDPEIYEESERVPYEDLTESEKKLFDTLRFINNQTHELNFEKGFISEDTYNKYKDSYIGRGYEVFEDLANEAEKEIFLDNRITGEIYKQRKDIDDWKIDNKVKDPIYLTINRMIRSRRNVAVLDYSNAIANSKQAVDEARPGYTQLKGKAYGELDGKYVPNHIAEDFKGYFFVNKIADGAYELGKAYDKTVVRQFLKRFHTVYSPVVQLGNLMSNQAFAFTAGINPVQLWANVPAAVRGIRESDSDYLTLVENGIIGTNILTPDLALTEEAQKSLRLKNPQNKVIRKVKQLDEFARRAYAGSDDLMKLTAYKALKQAGLSDSQAVERVFEGFQNYATVGKIWDLASKTPIIGNAYIKFQADLTRIIKNSVLKRPLTTAAFLSSIKAMTIIASVLSGESEEEREIREARPFIPKINTGFADIPLVFKAGDKEVNLSRYISPFYDYDVPNKDWVESLTRFTPFQLESVESDKLGQSEVTLSTPDVLLGNMYSAFFANRDFRQKSITDPYSSRYKESGLSEDEKLLNRLEYVSRSVVPLFAPAQDIYLSSQYGEDFFGRDKTIEDIVLSKLVKIQTFDDESLRKTTSNSLKSIRFEQKKINGKIKSIRGRYKREVQRNFRSLNDGNITQEKYDRRLEKEQENATKRINKQLELLVKQQEKMNELVRKINNIPVLNE